ncbi:unnamed protein product [Ectocarpus fasciculatus]
MRSLSPNVVEHILQWLDLASHLRLREASTFDRDETPRRTTTLIARGSEQARRCQLHIFTPDKKTRLHSITLDVTAPSSGSSSSSCGMAPTQHLSSFNTSFSSFLDESSCATRRTSLPFLVREHRPAEIRFKNMVRGGEFSDALLSLELNISQVRESLCVLDVGLTAGGPRPYQDPRSHHWCMLRLRRLLGPGPLAGVGAGVGGGGEEEEEEDAVDMELAELTVELMGAANAAAVVPHLIEALMDEEEGVGEEARPEQVRSAAATLGAQVGGLKAYWPCLRELTLSCGIMRGDLEGLAACFGR